MCYGKSVDIAAMYNRKYKWATAVAADALEIRYTFYRSSRHCFLTRDRHIQHLYRQAQITLIVRNNDCVAYLLGSPL